MDLYPYQIAVFMMNWTPHGYTKAETVIVKLNNIGNGKEIYRIDSDNCNPDVVWQKQIGEMVNASNTYTVLLMVILSLNLMFLFMQWLLLSLNSIKQINYNINGSQKNNAAILHYMVIILDIHIYL
eukprot:306800_1